MLAVVAVPDETSWIDAFIRTRADLLEHIAATALTGARVAIFAGLAAALLLILIALVRFGKWICAYRRNLNLNEEIGHYQMEQFTEEKLQKSPLSWSRQQRLRNGPGEKAPASPEISKKTSSRHSHAAVFRVKRQAKDLVTALLAALLVLALLTALSIILL